MSNRVNERAYKVLLENLPKAKRVTSKRIKDRHMGAESVMAQLEFIETFVQTRKPPQETDIEKINLNLFCCRELDGVDDEWASLIGETGAYFDLLNKPEREDFHEGPWKRLKKHLPIAFEMTDACLKLHPKESLFFRVKTELEYIAGIHGQHRKPTYEERCFITQKIACVRSSGLTKNIENYRRLIAAINLDWKALCEAPEKHFDPDQGGCLYPDLSFLDSKQ